MRRGWGRGGRFCVGILGTAALPPISLSLLPRAGDRGGLRSIPCSPGPPSASKVGPALLHHPAARGALDTPNPPTVGNPVPGRRIPACTAAAAAFPWRWHLPSPHSLSGRVSMEMPYPARHNLSKRFLPRCCSRDPRTRSGAVPAEMGGQGPRQLPGVACGGTQRLLTPRSVTGAGTWALNSRWGWSSCQPCHPSGVGTRSLQSCCNVTIWVSRR